MIPHNRVYILTLTVTIVSGQLITYKDGKLGVNFAGFHAAVGLGGLLNGDLSKGGLHAEAGTPFGQSARAGLGGAMGSNGQSQGGLYAGATAGNGVSAAAGLQGAADGSGTVGQAAAGASAGGAFQGVEKTYVRPNFQIPNDEESGNRRVDRDNDIALVKNKKKLSKFAQAHYDAVHSGAERPQRQDEVKYVEKPLEPSQSTINTQISSSPPQGGLLTRLFVGLGNGAQPNDEPKEPNKPKDEGQSTNSVTKSVHYSATGAVKNGNLFNDIFNIPISTLQAVNRLVNNIVGGGTVALTKSLHHNN